jgi:hypothetical protein
MTDLTDISPPRTAAARTGSWTAWRTPLGAGTPPRSDRRRTDAPGPGNLLALQMALSHHAAKTHCKHGGVRLRIGPRGSPIFFVMLTIPRCPPSPIEWCYQYWSKTCVVSSNLVRSPTRLTRCSASERADSVVSGRAATPGSCPHHPPACRQAGPDRAAGRRRPPQPPDRPHRGHETSTPWPSGGAALRPNA